MDILSHLKKKKGIQVDLRKYESKFFVNGLKKREYYDYLHTC